MCTLHDFLSSKVRFIYTSTVTGSHSCSRKNYAYASRTSCLLSIAHLMVYHKNPSNEKQMINYKIYNLRFLKLQLDYQKVIKKFLCHRFSTTQRLPICKMQQHNEKLYFRKIIDYGKLENRTRKLSKLCYNPSINPLIWMDLL